MTTQLLEQPVTITVPDTEAGRVTGPTTGGSTTIPTYRVGTPDIQCRYPVIVGEDQVIGRAYRWHRDWLVITTEGERNLRRPPRGTPGTDMAAAHLAEEYAAGRIGAVPLDQVLAEAPKPLSGPVPLLHPRMPINDRNIESAQTAFAGLAAHHWRAVLTGFPGPTTTGTSPANCAPGKVRSSGHTCADATDSLPARTATRAGASGRTRSAD